MLVSQYDPGPPRFTAPDPTFRVSLVMMTLASVARDRIRRFRNYRWTILLLLVLALPVHPGAVVTLPASLWCIHALLRTNARIEFN